MPPRRPLALLASVCLFAPALIAQDADDALSREVKRAVDVLSLVQSYAADPVDTSTAVYQGAIPGLLRKLDPHSVFFDPGQFEQLQQMERSTSKGFGSIVSVLPGRVIVLQTLPGTPSARSGIAPGDEILAVNNIRLAALNLEQLTQLLGESHQRPAQLYVRRSGSVKLLEFTLTPEEMQSDSVDRAFLLSPGVGYVRIASFEEKTGPQFRQALEKLDGKHLKSLVIDLRSNPGGLVTAALDVASMLLPPNSLLLTIRGRHVPEQEQRVAPNADPLTCKIAVLINERTASAAEIVAGALQDHDRATIAGVPSFGKGLVQSVFPMAEKTGLALTTALYYTPSGRSIQKPFKSGDFALSETAANPNESKEFKSDKGRPLKGGGGIVPDVFAESPLVSRLHQVLEVSAAFVNFATEFVQTQKVDEKFEVTPALLDRFQSWLAERSIQPGLAEWGAEREFIRHRLQSEILNQSVGVAKGDEIEMRYDPQVRAALSALDPQGN